MADTYTKLFSSITLSTIWREDHPTRIVWITMLALADKHGYVGASVPGLADAARVTLDECVAALNKFKAPDAWSRSPDHEGRRIEDADRGWNVLNHDRYRDMRDEDVHREVERERKREQRRLKAETATRKHSENQAICPDGPSLSQLVPACPAMSREVGSQIISRSSTTQEREEEKIVSRGRSDAAKAAKPRRSKPAAIVALETALSAVMADRGETAPAMSQSLATKAAKRVTDHAVLAGVTLDESARMLAASWASSGHANAWKLCDVPFTSQGAERAFDGPSRGGNGRPARLAPSPGTTHLDFADYPSVDEQLANVGVTK